MSLSLINGLWSSKGEDRAIFNDDGTKRSAKGLIKVTGENGMVIGPVDQVSAEEARTGLLETVYNNGQLLKEQSLQEIRLWLAQQRENSN